MPAAPAIAAAVPATVPAAATAAAAAQPALGFPVSDWVTFPVIALVVLGLIWTLVTVRNALGAPNSGWSLKDALSEEADVTQTAADGSPVMAGGAPVKITRLAASSSRLIAFIGMLAILFLYLGFGIFILWGFSHAKIPTG